jgi:hypothetical protein
MHRYIIVKCGSEWRPLSSAVRSILRIFLPARMYTSCKGGRESLREYLSRFVAIESVDWKGTT